MISNDKDLISFRNLTILSVNVADKISNKHIINFLKTSLLLEHIELKPSHQIYFSFISEANIYEIILINTNLERFFLEIQIFEKFYKKQISSTIDLFITKEFFVVYKNQKLYLCKKNDNYETNDIIDYISFKYKIKIDNIYNYNEKSFDKSKKEFLEDKNKNMLNYITLKQTSQHLFYMVYLIFILIFSGYFLFNHFNQNKQISNINDLQKLQMLKIKYKNLLQKHQNNPILYKNIIEFFNYLKVYKIALLKIKIDKKLTATILASTKEPLYDFVLVYKKRIKIDKIYKDIKSNKFFMDIEIEF